MTAEDPGAAYVALALHLDRHAPGLVTGWTGGPALAGSVAAQPPRPPAALALSARALAARLPDLGLPGVRLRSLSARLTALATTAGRLAGEPVGYADEVAACFGVRPTPGDPQRYARAHARLAELLPGPGSLGARLGDWRASVLCPPAAVPMAVEALAAALRAATATTYALPADEECRFAAVPEAPWAGSARYLGGHRTRVLLATAPAVRLSHLPSLVAHEGYPGHHTAACRADDALVRDRGWVEHALSLVATPDRVVAEGAAQRALAVAIGPDWGRWAQEVLGGVGLALDGELAQEVVAALAGLDAVRQDASLLLHAEGGSVAAATDLLICQGLFSVRGARHAVAFLTHPLWRGSITAYVEGARLVGDWLARRPAGVGQGQRYARLLDEPLLPDDLTADLAAGT